ncbi:hypothetical protein FNF29_05247 [Cafeteria roenbergensis]|uniref:GTP cyclohydrolase II domain-containing protein n=1 Tax=Cafeteria roenbergensis TaxID=33653 RepID=A0A5A8CD02_CAFRO|nr:hypothetical protein FNF29_05247 [Cafeteria roenbergensis]|eukprot:KAA0150444.1 hypothetical protein FNF29_05247 [Cafeteria roenbergensis]
MDLRVYVNEAGVEASALVAWPAWVVAAAVANEAKAEDAVGLQLPAHSVDLCPGCAASDASGRAAPEECLACESLAAKEPGDPARPYLLWRLNALQQQQQQQQKQKQQLAGTGRAAAAAAAAAVAREGTVTAASPVASSEQGAAPPSAGVAAGATLPAPQSAASVPPATGAPLSLPLVRVHDACATSELFGSVKCDCAQQLAQALRRARARADHPSAAAPGAVVYLPQEGRGIGLAAKAAAYSLQRGGADTVDANRMLGLADDTRRYDAARDALFDAGLAIQGPLGGLPGSGIRLLSNNPRKAEQLTALGVAVDAAEPHLVAPPSALAAGYMQAKADRMGHAIPQGWLRDAAASARMP